MTKRGKGAFDFDTILPSQFFGIFPGQAQGRKGEHQLLVAILEDAIHCYQKHARATKLQRRLSQEAEQWIMAGDSGDKIFLVSFDYVCQELGIDAGYLRRGIQRWRAAQRADLRTHAHRPACLDLTRQVR